MLKGIAKLKVFWVAVAFVLFGASLGSAVVGHVKLTWWLFGWVIGLDAMAVGWVMVLSVVQGWREGMKEAREAEQISPAERLWTLKTQAEIDAMLTNDLVCRCGHVKSRHCEAPPFLPEVFQLAYNHCHGDGDPEEDHNGLPRERACSCPAFLEAVRVDG